MPEIVDVETGEVTDDAPETTSAVLTHSEEIDKIAPALVKAQGLMEGVGKDAVNPHFGSKYATIGSIWKMARPHLLASGIAVIQAPTTVRDGDRRVVKLETTLLHTSGQWMRSAIEMPIEKPTAQGVGSAITYSCRYAMAPMLGITTGEDDDGNEASDGAKKRPKAGDKPKDDLEGLL